MRILLVAWGSRGDVVPLVALGLGLARAGHEISVAVARDLAHLVTDAGLDCRPFAISLEREQDPVVARWLAGSHRPYRELQLMRAALRHFAPILANGLAAMVEDAEAVVSGVISTAGLAPWARRTGRPLVAATLLPQYPTASADASLYPARPGHSRLNRLAGGLQLALGYSLFGRAATATQRELGQPPAGLRGYLDAVSGTPTVIGVSPTLLPPPPDWPAHFHVTGAWRPPVPSDYLPPGPLAAFLAEGPPPVYLGFGSMPSLDSAALRTLVLEAAGRAGVRAVLGGALHGSGRPATRLSPTAISVAPVPFGWLLPRTAGVVAHGGVGTTDAALAAGVPIAVVPHISDQYYWGRRVHELGAGPAPLPRRDLTVDRLAGRLVALREPALRARASLLGQQLSREDGVARAVETISGVLA